MPEREPLTVVWTENSLANAVTIKEYLDQHYTKREIETFYSLLKALENTLSVFPQLYPPSGKKKKIHRAVLSKELSAFYRIKAANIEVLAILDNRCDLSGWLR